MANFFLSIWPAVVTAILGALVIWALLNEAKLIDFEDRVADAIKRHVRIRRRNLAAKWLAKDGLIAVPVSRSK
jgi:hypothetical protein